MQKELYTVTDNTYCDQEQWRADRIILELQKFKVQW